MAELPEDETVAYYDDKAMAWRCNDCDAVLRSDGDCPRCDFDDGLFGEDLTVPDYAERVRMALAEVGRSEHVENSDRHRSGVTMFGTPDEVAWNAARTAGVPLARCLRCFLADPYEHHGPTQCLALGQFVRDCGIDGED